MLKCAWVFILVSLIVSWESNINLTFFNAPSCSALCCCDAVICQHEKSISIWHFMVIENFITWYYYVLNIFIHISYARRSANVQNCQVFWEKKLLLFIRKPLNTLKHANVKMTVREFFEFLFWPIQGSSSNEFLLKLNDNLN